MLLHSGFNIYVTGNIMTSKTCSKKLKIGRNFGPLPRIFRIWLLFNSGFRLQISSLRMGQFGIVDLGIWPVLLTCWRPAPDPVAPIRSGVIARYSPTFHPETYGPTCADGNNNRPPTECSVCAIHPNSLQPAININPQGLSSVKLILCLLTFGIQDVLPQQILALTKRQQQQKKRK